MVLSKRLELSRISSLAPEANAYTDFATRADHACGLARKHEDEDRKKNAAEADFANIGFSFRVFELRVRLSDTVETDDDRRSQARGVNGD